MFRGAFVSFPNPSRADARCARVTAWLLAALMACLPALASAQTVPGIPGHYAPITLPANPTQPPPPAVKVHGLDVAVLDVYQSFLCPHCQRFYPVLLRLRAKYGKRLVVREHFLALSERMLNPDMRLYIVAQRVGVGDAAARLLMTAGLDMRDPQQQLAVTTGIAKQLALQEPFARALEDPAITREIHERGMQMAFVDGTPMVVLNRQLAVGTEPQNLVTVLDAVLKPEEG